MKSLLQAADDLYNYGLEAVATVEGMHGTLPEVRDAISRLKKAMMHYEYSRFARREITVTFKCPAPPKEIEERKLTRRCQRPRQVQTLQKGEEVAKPERVKPRIKKKNGDPIKA